ncbi:MAG: hypothetical protein ACK5MA_04290 [Parachlamydiaceae bacterium]
MVSIVSRSLPLRAPKKPNKASEKIKTLHNSIELQKQELTNLNNELKFFHIPIKYWDRFKSVTAVSGVGILVSQNIYEIVNVNDNSDQCSNSQATILVGTIVFVVGIIYIIAEAIVGCGNKKRDRMIAPLETELKVLASKEQTLETIREFLECGTEEEDEKLSKCTRQLAASETPEISSRWTGCLGEQLNDKSEIKKLLKKGSEIARNIASSSSSSYSMSEETLRKRRIKTLEDSLSSSTSVSGKESFTSTSSSSGSTPGSSPILQETNADNSAAPPSPKPSAGDSTPPAVRQKRELKEITKKLKARLGVEQFQYNHVTFDSRGHVLVTIE